MVTRLPPYRHLTFTTQLWVVSHDRVLARTIECDATVPAPDDFAPAAAHNWS